MLSNHLILYQPLHLLPSIFPRIKVFSNESVLHIRRPKYWNLASASVLPMNVQVDFLQDWLVWSPCCPRGSKRFLQDHNLKASVLWCSALFMVQLLHPYMTTGKTIALTRWTFVGKGMSLLFNTLSRFVIAFLPRSKCLLISWLQSPSTVILELRGEGLEVELITNIQWFHQPCQLNSVSIKHQKDRVGRASRLVNTWRFWKDGVPWKGREAPCPFLIPCPRHLYHLAVSGLYPFIVHR